MNDEDEKLISISKEVARNIFIKLWGKSMSDINFTEEAYPEIYWKIKELLNQKQ